MTWNKIKNNYVLEGNGYYIAYNPQTGADRGPDFTSMANMLATFCEPGTNFKDGEETALRDKINNEWYILEGDFRKEYEVCSTLEECMEVYNKNINRRSNWSTK